MITNFKIFESNLWKKGDIVVAIVTKYGALGRWLKEGEEYQIIDIDSINNKVLVKSNIGDEKYPIYHYFPNDYFMSVEDWNINQDINKYNV